jgi:hypothetical protein
MKRVNRSRLKLERAGRVSDGGPPRCRECDLRLQFGTDRVGRATEFCVWRILRVREDAVWARRFATGWPVGGHASAVFTAATRDSRDATLMRTAMAGNGSGRGHATP